MSVIVSKKHQVLVVPPDPGLVTMFPSAPKLPDGNLVIPHGIREKLLLDHMGYSVPNPMLLHYDWPGGDAPFKVQQITCKLLTEHRRAYVLNGLGTGKTRTALWSWDYMNRAGLCKKLLVVAPRSTLNFTWANEVFSTLPERRCVVLYGSREARLTLMSQDADIYIINHDGLKVIETELWARADIDTLIIDELAVYRNNSDRSKRMRKFANRFNIVWGMTGAPMPNEPTDVWGQCMIITPYTVPKYRLRAKEMLMTKKSQYKWVPKPDAVANAFRMMQPSVRFSLDDVTELPELVVPPPIEVPLSPDQKTAYQRVSTAMKTMVQNQTITALNAGAAMSKLLQISGGWVYTSNPDFVRLDPTPRLAALVDLINAAEHKVLVAIPYRHALHGISKIFSMKGVDIDHCVVDGQTQHRERLFNAFQSTDKYRVMLVHPQCVAHGVTLTAADTTIWYLPITSLDIYEQFNARFRRVGQKHKQQLFHLQSTATEKKIYRMLREHQKTQDMFLSLVEQASEDF